MRFTITTQGRPGKRTRAQRLQEEMRRANTALNPYSIGGRKKEGRHKPRPTTWPKLKFMEGPDPE